MTSHRTALWKSSQSTRALFTSSRRSRYADASRSIARRRSSPRAGFRVDSSSIFLARLILGLPGAGLDQILCFMQMGNLAPTRIMHSIGLFGRHVIPAFT